MSFRFQKKLVPLSRREADHLVLDRGAITRSPGAYRPPIHRRLGESLLDDSLALVLEVCDPAGKLGRVSRPALRYAALRPEVRPGVIEIFNFAFLPL